MIKWQKQGVLFHLGGERAQSPTAILLGDIIRIYYSSRVDGKSHIYYISVNPKTMEVIFQNKYPVLSPGEPGSFDENGCVPGCAVQNPDSTQLYYTGFSSGQEGNPYSLSIGRAISKDEGKTFIKDKKWLEPATKENNWIVTSPYVLPVIHETMPFLQLGWQIISSKGTGWHKGAPIYKFNNFGRYPLQSTARPAMIRQGNIYKIWFSYREAEDFRGGKGSYRMGYAESQNLETWLRDDSKAGIDVGEPGEFDSEMIAYPSIVRVGQKLILFYNGNGFGATGIGWATCEI